MSAKKNGRLKIPKYKYVTLHCRHNILQIRKKNNRNLKKNEFLKIVKKIKNRFKKHRIMVVSDKLGCKFFKKFAIEKKLKIEFSKEFSSSFINDGILVLNSDYYFPMNMLALISNSSRQFKSIDNNYLKKVVMGKNISEAINEINEVKAEFQE